MSRVVLHLIEGLGVGGAEQILRQLVLRLRDKGYEPLVCCLVDGPLRPAIEDAGIEVVCLGVKRPSILRFHRFVLEIVRVLYRLVRLARQRRVALIHAHMQDAALLAAVAGPLAGAAVVVTWHGLGVFPAGRSRLDPRNRLRRLLYRVAAALSDRSIAVSEPVRELLCDELHFNPAKTRLILNGIDTRAFLVHTDVSGLRRSLHLSSSDMVVLCVARLVENKGQRWLVQSAVSILQRCPRTVILLAGDGPDRPVLEEMIATMGLQERVRLLGERSDVPELLALADVFVLPSDAEGVPLALVEAMAAGKAVVATAVPGNIQVLAEGKVGLLVPPRDASALADAISRLLEDPMFARSMGKLARARAHASYDISVTAGQHAALYDEVLRTRGLPRR